MLPHPSLRPIGQAPPGPTPCLLRRSAELQLSAADAFFVIESDEEAEADARCAGHRPHLKRLVRASEHETRSLLRPGQRRHRSGGRARRSGVIESDSGSADETAIAKTLSGRAKTICLTRGAKGTRIIEAGQTVDVPAVAITALDANGAGDMFAGAFLYGVSRGMAATQATKLANKAAAAVVSQYGNRLTTARVQALLAEASV